MEVWKLIISLILSTIVATAFGVLIIPPVWRSLYMVLSIGIPVLIIGTICYVIIYITDRKLLRRKTKTGRVM